MGPPDHELTFYLNTRQDGSDLELCLQALRAHYPTARVILRSDGDSDHRIAMVGERYHAEVTYGEWLFSIERGGEVVETMLRLFLERPTGWLFKIDPDTRVHRRFGRLPTHPCIFGTLQQQGGLYSIQGGCVGFTRSVAETLVVSGCLREPALAKVPPPWAFNEALRSRPVERGLTSVDWVVGWVARTLEIPLWDWPEILSEWKSLPPNSDALHAITHPHKTNPSMPIGENWDPSSCTSVRFWGPERLLPTVISDVMQAPLDIPLERD